MGSPTNPGMEIDPESSSGRVFLAVRARRYSSRPNRLEVTARVERLTTRLHRDTKDIRLRDRGRLLVVVSYPPQPLDAADLVHRYGDRIGNEVVPFLSRQHPSTDLRAAVPISLVEGVPRTS